MKSVVLFFPNHKFGRSVQPRNELPLGLLAVGTPLDVAGYEVRIIDQRVDKNWERDLAAALKNNPICFGVSMMTGPQIAFGLKASRMVKEHGSIPIIWGGIHPTILPRQTIDNPYIDVVVQGEGEATFFQLVQTLERDGDLSEVRGIWYKKDDEIRNTEPRAFIDLNEQPPLSYHLVDVEKYFVDIFGKKHLTLETSRGCPFNCNYCYNTRVYNSIWRGLTVDETIRRIKILMEDYGIEGVLFSDDNFFGNRERAIKILERIKEENLDILCSKIDGHLSVLSKLSDYEVQLLKNAGCTMLMIGVESGSPNIIRMMRKELKIDALLEFNARIRGSGIMVLYFFMMGYPGETDDDLVQTISLYNRLIEENPQAVSHMNIYVPFPGTGLFDIAVEQGFQVPKKLEDWIPLNWRMVNEELPWLSNKRKKIIRMLHFATLLAERNNFLDPYKKTNILIVLIAKLYYPIAKRRVKKLYYKFPIEIKLAEWLGLYPKQG